MIIRECHLHMILNQLSYFKLVMSGDRYEYQIDSLFSRTCMTC